ncbi:MAG: hypothetical protein NC191_00625 [Muribaculaceae bacterium]|nr:hypothetical protein [Muribaculaceae bacterium]
MILLFGDKATKSRSSKANHSNNVKNQPVENAGILAMSLSDAKSLLTLSEYDTYISSNPVAIDYAMYANYNFTDGEDSGFMSGFSAAVAMLGDCGFSSGGFDCGGGSFSGSSCSSFSSVG